MLKDTKTALLDFAETAARTRGYDGFSYADLAQAVGIRKASIHYHFPAKSDLSVALMERYTTEMKQACAEIDAAFETAGDRLLALIDHYREALDGGDHLCLCVSFSISRESLNAQVLGWITTFRKMMTDWLRTVFQRGLEDGSVSGVQQPEHEARAALALLEGAHLAARANEDVATFDAAVALLRARV